MSAATYLTPRLGRLATKYREALTRVEQVGDEEAIHDLRVVLRRLRSLLKPARVIYGVFHTESVRAALKTISDATGELRDEEVLAQTLSTLSLPEAEAKARSLWLKSRKSREVRLRTGFLELLGTGQAHRASALLDALLLLPVDPASDRPLADFAVQVVEKADQRVLARVDADPADIEALHRLRILYKRLRYAAEGFSEALPPELAAKAKIAERFQKLLGEIHDIDVASAVVQGETPLPQELRQAMVLELQKERTHAVLRWMTERRAPAANATPAPPPVSSKAPPSRKR